MNRRQTSKLAMYTVTASLETEGDPQILAMMPNFITHVGNLKVAIATIDTAAKAQMHYTATVSGNKQDARTRLEERMFITGSAVRAWAIANNDTNLAAEWNLTLPGLSRMKDKDLLLKARNLIEASVPLANELIPFGISKEESNALYDAANLFDNLMPSPRKNQISKADATKALESGFAHAESELGHMDVLAELLHTREPAFYTDYQNRRTPIKPASRPLALFGSIRDDNGNPLKNVSITIDGLPDTAQSTARGNFRFPTLPDGVHNLHFKRHGYQELIHTVAITNGQRAKIDIELRTL